jgi:predicted permease
VFIRGPHAELIKRDLDDLYLRDRAQGMSWWRARWRHANRLGSSAFHVWRGNRPQRQGRGGSMLQDFRFALRLFRKHSVPVGIAIGGLALAIGVVASVFTIADAATLRPYGMDAPQSVVQVAWAGERWGEWSYSTFLRMREQATLTHPEGSQLGRVRWSTASANAGDTSRWMLFVSGGYLQTFGGRPAIGRALESADDLPGAPPVVALSHQLWSTQLGADPDVVGKTMWLNGTPAIVVGVLRPDFTGPARILPALWAPFSAFDDIRGGPAYGSDTKSTIEVFARVQPGVSRLAAQDEMDGIVKRAIFTTKPPTPGLSIALNRAAAPIDQDNPDEAYLGLAILAGILGLVLAVACANTANLLLAAATTRAPEMGLRLALGATTGRLIRQTLSESLMLGLIAGGLGYLLAIWLVPMFTATLETSMQSNAAPDGRVLLFTIVVAVLSGVGAGLSPARHGVRRSVLPALKSQTAVGGRAPSRLRTSFIGLQAAASTLLLVCAALLARAATEMVSRDIGYDANRLLIVGNEGFPKDVSEAAYTDAALRRLRDVRSVERAAVFHAGLFVHVYEHNRFTRGGRTFQMNVIRSDAEFFPTAGLRVVRGRSFTAEEVAGGASVALISETVAREFFNGSDPVGQSISSVMAAEALRDDRATIIGVVGDALLEPIENEVAGTIYRPISQTRQRPPFLLVRTASPGMSARAVEDAMRQVDARVRPTTTIVSEELDAFLGVKRMLAWLSAPIALGVLLLAAVGVFGVTAFVVSQRMPEMSLRVAIGASPADLLRLAIKDSLRPVAIGLVVGLGAALVVSRALVGLGFFGGISPSDPLAIGAAVSILIVAGLTAVVIPARRAAKADPASLLRST